MSLRVAKGAAAALAFTIARGAIGQPKPVDPPPEMPRKESDPKTVEVVVQGPRLRRDAVEVSVDARQGRQLPGTQGDPVKVIENLPGVARPSFGSGQLIVWGSAPSDTRIYVDGVEVPRLFHGNALRSTINGDLVRDVALTPGAYGVDYGRGLGGLVRVETRDLSASGVHGYAAADVLDGSAMVSAAPSRRFRLAAAARYGWIDRVLGATSIDVADGIAIPRYRDYQAKAQFEIRDRESLNVAFLGSGDELERAIHDADPAHTRQEKTGDRFERLYLQYRREREDQRTEITPWVGRDAFSTAQRFGVNPADLEQATWRWGLRAAHREVLVSPINLTVGVDVAGSSSALFRRGSLSIPGREGDISVFGRPPGDDHNADRWRVDIVNVAPHATFGLRFGQLSLTAGLRADAYLLETSRQTPRVGQTPSIGLSQLEAVLGPRFSARWQVVHRLAVSAGAGVYSQPPSSVDMSAVFGTPRLGPSTAYHATLGQSVELAAGLSLETVGFFKWLEDLAIRDPSPTPALANVLLEDGAGRAYGLQMLLRQQPWHGFFGWITYTVSRSERRDSADLGWRRFDQDQSQVLSAVGSKIFGPWSFGVRFRYARGLPRTAVIGSFYDSKDNTFQPVFGAQNAIRLPDFWQLDLRVDRRFELTDDAKLVIYLEVLNVTSRANGEEYAYSVDYQRRGLITGLPMIAALGARVEF